MVTLLRPMWTEQMYPSVGGQDHLGLGSVVTDKILPSLSPGINVLTPHPRYWSFYAFVVDEFWRRDLPRTNAALRRFLRQKESIFSVAGHLCDRAGEGRHATPIGSRRVGPLVREGRSKYSAGFDYMKSSGGGYGLYYATVMQSTGVVRLADRDLGLPADTVTPEVGVAVADAFRSAISGTKYWRRYFDSDEVPASVIEELASECCLCRLRDDAPDREPLVDVFLHGGHATQSAARRLSLQMLLELSAQTSGVALSQDDFRRLVLYQSAYDKDSDEETATFTPPAHLTSVVRRWRLSQLREMFNWSLNGMWQWLSGWGLDRGGDTLPIPMLELRHEIDHLALGQLPGVGVRADQPIGDLIAECRELASVTDSLDGRWELWTGLTEDNLLGLLRADTFDRSGQLAALAVMYVMSLSRLAAPDLPGQVGPEDWRPVREGGMTRIGMQFALDQLRRDERDVRSVADVIWRVVNEHVIAQHERVALAKLPDDTFRFRRDAGRMRFFEQSTEFQRNDSRFNSLATVCAELGWSGFLNEDAHGLTEEGEQIRCHGDLGSV
jgi:hypothetical protein